MAFTSRILQKCLIIHSHILRNNRHLCAFPSSRNRRIIATFVVPFSSSSSGGSYSSSGTFSSTTTTFASLSSSITNKTTRKTSFCTFSPPRRQRGRSKNNPSYHRSTGLSTTARRLFHTSPSNNDDHSDDSIDSSVTNERDNTHTRTTATTATTTTTKSIASRIMNTMADPSSSMTGDSTTSNTLGSALLSSMIPFLWKCGSVVVALVAVFGGILYAKQDSLLYFPEIGGVPKRPSDNPRGYRSPGERQIPFENLRIPCRDGVVIHAWLLLRTTDGVHVPPQTPTIIFFHGNAGNIGLRLPNAIQMMQYLQANVMMVEYRGYGESDNVAPNEDGIKLDAEAALHYAMQHSKIDPSRIFIFGRSLGGAVAFHLAHYAQTLVNNRATAPDEDGNNVPRIAGVMVENTFTSISAMVDQLMPFLTPIKPLVLKINWDSTVLVPSLTMPILYLAGSDDELVPHDHMQKLVQLSTLSKKVQVHIIQGGTHNESWLQGGAAYWDAMKAFMNDAIDISTGAAHVLGGAGTVTIGYSGTPTTTSASGSSSSSSAAAGAGTSGASGASSSSIPIMPTGYLDLAKEATNRKSKYNKNDNSGGDNKSKDL